eukprot:Filipodium_phascolosomae@DN5003_c0_g1_i1.p1
MGEFKSDEAKARMERWFGVDPALVGGDIRDAVDDFMNQTHQGLWASIETQYSNVKTINPDILKNCFGTFWTEIQNRCDLRFDVFEAAWLSCFGVPSIVEEVLGPTIEEIETLKESAAELELKLAQVKKRTVEIETDILTKNEIMLSEKRRKDEKDLTVQIEAPILSCLDRCINELKQFNNTMQKPDNDVNKVGFVTSEPLNTEGSTTLENVDKSVSASNAVPPGGVQAIHEILRQLEDEPSVMTFNGSSNIGRSSTHELWKQRVPDYNLQDEELLDFISRSEVESLFDTISGIETSSDNTATHRLYRLLHQTAKECGIRMNRPSLITRTDKGAQKKTHKIDSNN